MGLLGPGEEEACRRVSWPVAWTADPEFKPGAPEPRVHKPFPAAGSAPRRAECLQGSREAQGISRGTNGQRPRLAQPGGLLGQAPTQFPACSCLEPGACAGRQGDGHQPHPRSVKVHLGGWAWAGRGLQGKLGPWEGAG